jgi:hypothetical protein
MDEDHSSVTSEGKGRGGGGSPEEQAQGSVFGNLPKTRPGVRSPRRHSRASDEDARTSPAETRVPAKAPGGSRAAAPGAAAPRAPAAARGPAEAAPQGPDEAGSLEDLAWAGVTAAAQAATLGVRIANRALEALREAVERR